MDKANDYTKRPRPLAHHEAQTLRDAMEDVIKTPSWYTRYKIQPKAFFLRNDLPGWMCFAIKYVMRAGFKKYPDLDNYKGDDSDTRPLNESAIRDLEKAQECIQWRINYLRGDCEI